MEIASKCSRLMNGYSLDSSRRLWMVAWNLSCFFLSLEPFLLRWHLIPSFADAPSELYGRVNYTFDLSMLVAYDVELQKKHLNMQE